MEEHPIGMGKIVMVAQQLQVKATTEVISLVVLVIIIMLVEEVLEVSVETEHQQEEETEVLGLSPQLLEQQHITPVVVVAGVTTLYQVLEEVLEA